MGGREWVMHGRKSPRARVAAEQGEIGYPEHPCRAMGKEVLTSGDFLAHAVESGRRDIVRRRDHEAEITITQCENFLPRGSEEFRSRPFERALGVAHAKHSRCAGRFSDRFELVNLLARKRRAPWNPDSSNAPS